MATLELVNIGGGSLLVLLFGWLGWLWLRAPSADDTCPNCGSERDHVGPGMFTCANCENLPVDAHADD